MKMENKKNYIKPELKSVEFKVELGFAASLTQDTGRLNYFVNRPINDYNPFNVHLGSYDENNDDWD